MLQFLLYLGVGHPRCTCLGTPELGNRSIMRWPLVAVPGRYDATIISDGMGHLTDILPTAPVDGCRIKWDHCEDLEYLSKHIYGTRMDIVYYKYVPEPGNGDIGHAWMLCPYKKDEDTLVTGLCRFTFVAPGLKLVYEASAETWGIEPLTGAGLDWGMNLTTSTAPATGTPGYLIYHGGIVGKAATDAGCMQQYMKRITEFANDLPLNVTLFNTVLSTFFKGVPPFLNDTSFFVEYFLDLLPAGSAGGILSYQNPKDSVTNFNKNTIASLEGSVEWGTGSYVIPLMKGGRDPMGTDGGVCTNGSDLEQLTDALWCTTITGQDFDCSVTQGSRTFQLGAGVCPWNSADPGGHAIAGCPSIPYQLTAFMRAINNQSTGVKMSYLAADQEDAHMLANLNYRCQFQIAANDSTLAQGDTTVILNGLAHGIHQDVTYPDDFGMPEVYWFNELWPCTGDPYQIGKEPFYGTGGHGQPPALYTNAPPVCTTWVPYRAFADQPAKFLQYLKNVQMIYADVTKDGNLLDAIRTNIENDGTTIIPLFSTENLSGGKGADNSGKNIAAGDRSCLAREMFGNTTTYVPGICGTFDGFSYWSLGNYTEFMRLFMLDMGYTSANITDAIVGIYESQFLPPSWFSADVNNSECGGHPNPTLPPTPSPTTPAPTPPPGTPTPAPTTPSPTHGHPHTPSPTPSPTTPAPTTPSPTSSPTPPTLSPTTSPPTPRDKQSKTLEIILGVVGGIFSLVTLAILVVMITALVVWFKYFREPITYDAVPRARYGPVRAYPPTAGTRRLPSR